MLARSELVVKIALDGVDTSTRYPGGLALRFARVKRYRSDRPAGRRAPSPRKVLPPKAEGRTIRHMCLEGPSQRIISEPIQPPVVLPAQPSQPEPCAEPRQPEHQPEPEPAAPS